MLNSDEQVLRQETQTAEEAACDLFFVLMVLGFLIVAFINVLGPWVALSIFVTAMLILAVEFTQKIESGCSDWIH